MFAFTYYLFLVYATFLTIPTYLHNCTNFVHISGSVPFVQTHKHVLTSTKHRTQYIVQTKRDEAENMTTHHLWTLPDALPQPLTSTSPPIAPVPCSTTDFAWLWAQQEKFADLATNDYMLPQAQQPMIDICTMSSISTVPLRLVTSIPQLAPSKTSLHILIWPPCNSVLVHFMIRWWGLGHSCDIMSTLGMIFLHFEFQPFGRLSITSILSSFSDGITSPTKSDYASRPSVEISHSPEAWAFCTLIGFFPCNSMIIWLIHLHLCFTLVQFEHCFLLMMMHFTGLSFWWQLSHFDKTS